MMNGSDKSNSKDFVKFDATILVLILAYFTVAQSKIDTNYSSGYNSIWGFFLGENLI